MLTETSKLSRKEQYFLNEKNYKALIRKQVVVISSLQAQAIG